MIKINEVLSKLFDKVPSKDEDGCYHYLLEEESDRLIVDITHITEWDKINMGNKLILSWNDENELAIRWFKDGKNIVFFHNIQIDDARIIVDEYLDEKGEVIKEKNIRFYSMTLLGKYLSVQIEPHLSIGLGIDHNSK